MNNARLGRTLIPGSVGTLLALASTYVVPKISPLSPHTGLIAGLIMLATTIVCVYQYARPLRQRAVVADEPMGQPAHATAEHVTPPPSAEQTTYRPPAFDPTWQGADQDLITKIIRENKIPASRQGDWGQIQNHLIQLRGYFVARGVFRLLQELYDLDNEFDRSLKFNDVQAEIDGIRQRIAQTRQERAQQ